MSNPLSIRPGETAEVEIGFSEAACHLGIAGKTMTVKLLDDGRMAQVYREDGSMLSFPITYSEAGIYRTEGPDGPHFYHY